MTLEFIKIIAILCSTTSLEDNTGSWSEFPRIQKLQKECRVYYYDCMEGKYTEDNLVKCDRDKK